MSANFLEEGEGYLVSSDFSFLCHSQMPPLRTAIGRD